MSHELATIQNKIAMVFAGESPWHHLGTPLTAEEMRNVEIAMYSATLNWNVELENMYLASGRPVESHRAVIRDLDRAQLGVVGKDYQPMQNFEIFGPLQDAIDKFGATIEAAGALGNGSRVWMLAKMPDSNSEIVAGDKIKPYFLIHGAHNGSAAVTARPSPIRVVCQNTLEAAFASDRAAVSIRHTASGPARLAEISRFIEKMLVGHARTTSVFKMLAQTPISLDDMIEYSEKVWPVKKQTEEEAVVQTLLADGSFKQSRAEEAREVVLALLDKGIGAELAPRTAWTAYNAVTEYVDHVSVNRRDGTPRTNGTRTALFGAGADLKERALDVALDMFLGLSADDPRAAARF